MKGRLPTPTSQLRMAGSSALRKPGRADRDEPQPELGAPERPGWLSKRACAEWDAVVGELVSTGTIAKCEHMVLALYSETVAEYHEAKEIVEREGMTIHSGRNGETVKPHPAVAIRDRARMDALQFARELGLSPVARIRVRVAAPPTDPTGKGRHFAGG